MTRLPFKEVKKTAEAFLCEMGRFFHGATSHSNPANRSPHQGQRLGAGPEMTTRRLMTPDPTTVRPTTSLHRALMLLIRKDLGALPVVDEDHGVVGILGEKEVLKAFNEPEAATVCAVMDDAPMTIDADQPIVEVIDRLMAHDLRRVFVCEKTRLVGVITRADLMSAILRVLQDRARTRGPSVVSPWTRPPVWGGGPSPDERLEGFHGSGGSGVHHAKGPWTKH